MATAILRFWTNSGLVLGADGLKYDVVDQRAIGTDAQKVFEIPGLPAAYAMYGEIGIGDNNPDTPILLDLSQEIRKLLDCDYSSSFDFFAYANRIAAGLHQSIAATKDRGAIWGGNQESIAPGQVLARIILCGCFDGTPMQVNIKFGHLNQRLLPPRVFPVDLQRSNPEVFGSLPVTQRLFLRQPESADLSLLEAAKKIERYIQFCDSEKGRKLDPLMCRTIGGHIHIAAITSKGFQWLKPPIGAQQ